MVSCKKDETPAPKVSFTVSINDKTATFTNTTENATSYSWDFGDQSALSTDENPTHVYEAYGDYDVRLTATGGGGKVTHLMTISVVKVWPKITIDGDFSDWDSIPAFYSGYGDASGALTEAKVTADGSAYLYFYIKGTADIGPVLEVFVNSDNDTTTGWSPGNTGWYDRDGSDYSVEIAVEAFNDGESDVTPYSTAYVYNPAGDPGWPWDGDYTDDVVDQIAGYVNNQVEFRVPYSAFPGMSTDKISIYFLVLDNTWTDIGWLPAVYQDPLLRPSYFSFQ